MRYKVELLAGYIKAELLDRETAEETREFWDAVLQAMRQHDVTRVLISVRSSRAIFGVEKYGLSDAMAQLATMDQAKVAIISDSEDLAKSHGYVERLARQRGLRFKAFRDEQAAADWLVGPRP
jgi:hypothetical protein